VTQLIKINFEKTENVCNVNGNVQQTHHDPSQNSDEFIRWLNRFN